ncbi:MAG TPA: Tex family protein [Longimicrobiaceae bacterium]
MSATHVHAERIASELGLRSAQVRAALELLAEGNTIPFVARYRKEATGELDEVQLRDIRDRNEYLVELDARRATILSSIEEQGKLDDELRRRIEQAESKAELEDLYRPFKPKRRTRATMAQERGLGPLAELIWEGTASDAEVRRRAAEFVDAEKGVTSAEDALAGARDILAERVADDANARSFVRELTRQKGLLESKAARGKEGETSKFQDYYDFSEPLRTIPSHRVLAIRRGEAEEFLVARIVAPEEEIVAGLIRRFAEPRAAREEMELVVTDAYRRLIAPSVEVELRTELKVAADDEAIRIFGQNLEGLLLAPPAGMRVTLGIDPGYRTGCKLAVVGRTGALVATGVIYLHQEERAKREIVQLVEKYGVELVGIGNGTASRETDRLTREALKEVPAERRPAAVLVNEAGASVYSASDLAREELPDLDLTLRSAVSIARRLQDPLAELVKIDPKSIGVGQYQHDVSQSKLKRRLDETVESCVNRVGVEVNTASPSLLSYVAGLGRTTAQRIVEYRDSRGPFRSRRELLEVPGVGARTFEQAAGFLRIRDGEDPLDASAVHPERYPVVARMAADLGVPVKELVGNEAVVERIQPERYVDDSVGLPTLRDILAELRKPGRDPREAFEAPSFREDVETIEDLKEGMVLPGTVTNVVAFGAFVDIGVHQDGLVHVSQLSDRFVQDPNDVVKVGDRVTVRVIGVDVPRNRIALSMKSEAGGAAKEAAAPRARKGVKVEPPVLRDGVAPNGMRIRRGGR